MGAALLLLSGMFWIIVWLAAALGAMFLAERRGQGKVFGFWLGLIFGPLGVFWIWCSMDDPRAIEESLIEKQQAKRCKQCSSIAHPRAHLCPACQSVFA